MASEHWTIARISSRHNWQPNRAGPIRGSENRLGRFHIVLRLGQKDVGDVGLRVSVVEREPTGLNLHHDPMARQEYVVGGRKDKAIPLGLAGRNGGGVVEALAVTASEDVHRYRQLITSHLRLARHFVRKDVDQ